MKEQSLKQQTKKGLYWKFAEQFANHGMQFIIGIVMARLLSPSDYGITALPAVFLAIAGIFAEAGFGSAMVRKPELKEEDLSTAFYYSTGIGIVMYALLFFASPWIADFYNTPVLKPLIRVTALGFLYGPMGTPQSIILQRRLDFKTPAKVSVACKIVAGIIGITMAFYGYGVWALTISSMLAGIVGLLIRFYVVRWYPKTGWSKESFKYLWGYGNKLMASSFIDIVFSNITPIVIGKFYSTTDLGIYNRAQSYAKIPSQQATSVLQNVTFPVLSKMQDNNEFLSHNYRRILKVSAFVVFPIMMLLAGLARPLIILMITAKWEASIILLQIICFSLMWYPIHAINLNLLKVKGRSDWFLKLEIIKKSYGIFIIAATLPFGIIIYCIGRVFASFIALIVNTHYTGRLINCGFWTQMKDLAPSYILSLITFLISWGVTQILHNLWLQLIIGGIAGSVFYLSMAYLLKMDQLHDVLYMLKRKS
jgi:O-antigen/teichoic acid export membrane protein